MFEHFTFGAQAQAQPREDIWDASPTDISFSEPNSAASSSFPFEWEDSQPELSTIVHQMSRQSLSHESETSQQSIWQTQSSPIMEFDDSCNPFNIEELSFVSTTRGMAKVKASYTDVAPMTLHPPSNNRQVACRREQRQRNTQMQMCAKHVRDISALVEDMVDGNSQCTLRQSTSKQNLRCPPIHSVKRVEDTSDYDPLYYENRGISPDSEPEDEGFAEMEEQIAAMKEEVSLKRRAYIPSGIRKHNGLGYRKSIEGINNCSQLVNGKLKVRSLPRMRKRTRIAPVRE
jgi:hypothetical protein